MVTMGLSIGHVVVVLALLVVVVTGKNEGMAIWEDSVSNRPPQYTLWDGNKFSAFQNMGDISGFSYIIQGAYSPLRDEAIVVGVTSDKLVTAQLYSGGKWSSLPFAPLDKRTTNSYWSGFDVRYESQSGNPLIVWYETSKGRMRYAKWTGSDWSFKTITTPVSGGQLDHVLNLEASPKSNEMVLLVRVMSKDSYAIVWDGGSWGNGVVLSNRHQYGLTNANVAFERQRGRAIIVYPKESNSLKYQIWNGETWSGERSVYPPAIGIESSILHLAISADPSTNRIVVGVEIATGGWSTVWDGNNNWGSLQRVFGKRWLKPDSTGTYSGKSLAATKAKPYYLRNLAVAFEGTSQRAIVTYSGEYWGIHYRTWSSSSGWSDEKRLPDLGGVTYSLMLYTDNGSNDIMLAVQVLKQGRIFYKWSGTGWGNGKVKRTWDAGTSLVLQPFVFMWKPTRTATKAPTPFPTRHPTPPPTTFPTPAPSIKPTLQPTGVPTPHPTRTPTAQPSPSPTTSPTSQPTPASTQPRTPVPSLKPTKVPTPAPTSFDQSLSITKNEITEDLDSTAEGTVAAGHQCESNRECTSSTCRNGVCMATSACYPLKHKFGESFFEHKVNVVFVASGFDTATREEWQAHVNRTYKSFENFKMFSNEVEQLNMFRVDPWELDSSYCALGCARISRLLCCDQKKALSLAQKCFPVGSNLQTVVIHNDERYGGGGYVNENIATVSTHPMASVVAVHELGHSLFDLADEYRYGSGTDADPNCDSTSSCDKWSDLIGNTPEGYDPVRCLPGCRNGNFYVGMLSFMNVLNRPMGAVNDRFTCCTYCALTKSFPSYCDVFDRSPNYLLNYCKINDYQGYGRASYDKEPLLSISDGSVQDDSTKYVHVEFPVWVSITNKTRSSGALVFKSKQSPLESGMFLRSLVEGDFSSPRMAVKQGFNSLCKVKVSYRTSKETLFYSRNTTIEVPISLDPADDDEPLVVSEQGGCRSIILDSKGGPIKKIRVKILDLS